MTETAQVFADVIAHGEIAILTMVNPSQRNAISAQLRDSMIAAMTRLNADPHVRAIVLTGAEGTFSSGGDVSAMTANGALLAYRNRMSEYHHLAELIAAGPKPVVAAVEGYAFGAGLSLALACDHVISARDSKFCSAFAKVGLMPDMGLLWSLANRVGLAKAKRLIAFATMLSGSEAYAMGLVDDLCDPGGARDAALAIAGDYAALAPAAFAIVKTAYANGAATSLDAALQAEAADQPALRLTEDHRNAASAFINKSVPTFLGR